MKNIIYYLGFLMLLTGCNSSKSKSVKRSLFNPGGKKVYTVFANRLDKTMSVVYGDKIEWEAAGSSGQPEPRFLDGAVLEVVTYAQQDNKYWYGSYINGPVQCVELLEHKVANGQPGQHAVATDISGDTDHWQYRLIAGESPIGSHPGADRIRQRIRQIRAKRAVFFP